LAGLSAGGKVATLTQRMRGTPMPEAKNALQLEPKTVDMLKRSDG
jgi:hypothetical protein